MTMLLTLATRSLASMVATSTKRKPRPNDLTMLDLPDFAIRHLELRGLNVPASMLSGWGLGDLDPLRDRADKAGCPCLVLIEDNPLPLGAPSPERRRKAADRIRTLAVAAHRLSCNALAISCKAADSDDALELVANEIREVIPSVERMEINLLIAPFDGLTFSPDRLTDLIKRIGGFRIGTLPDFGHAAKTENAVETLRKLAPYAGAVHATIQDFNEAGEHPAYDLAECVAAIRSVGFLNTLAIDHVGSGDPIAAVDRARAVLQEAIDAG